MRSFRSFMIMASAVALVGSAQVAHSADPVGIGAIYLDSQGYYAGVRKGVQDGAAALKRPIRLVETTAQDDPSKESGFIDTLVSANVKAILLSAVSADGSVHAIKRAHQAGIPIVCYNTCVNDTAMKKYVYAYVVGDPVAFGSKLGGAAADYFVKAGLTAPKLAVVNCEFVEVCINRRKGFETALLARVPGATFVDNQQGTTVDTSVAVAEKIMTAHPDLDAFFGESGGATLGATKAVQHAGNSKVVVFGSDMTSDIGHALAAHTILKAVVDISGKSVGRLAIQQAMDAVDGKSKGSRIVPADIGLYTTTDEANAWLGAHSDGIP
ncbi:substrate-binding domain-containing protein [Lichenicola cladoniae]|uniref:Substrate-binding domain-containing protein n=1 Tax=Lichenicola cladoniae TaxID=1484109 RepID=A0A6M8HT14_9PROT|nr:substrate-binding domain-containing protein [Lichenicola cladoniae]NPD65418.1 substrate-binding domain-containing protein [Acetobacteraceae bacterium]QKE91508.1 substrate-binding domain-containing protein [Lichenicola cladoniae]